LTLQTLNLTLSRELSLLRAWCRSNPSFIISAGSLAVTCNVRSSTGLPLRAGCPTFLLLPPSPRTSLLIGPGFSLSFSFFALQGFHPFFFAFYPSSLKDPQFLFGCKILDWPPFGGVVVMELLSTPLIFPLLVLSLHYFPLRTPLS